MVMSCRMLINNGFPFKCISLPALIGMAISFTSCEERENQTLFRLVPESRSGISFVNEIVTNDTLNIITHDYLYNGAGVGIGDFNNDGLSDIFFAGNLVRNKLYLNRGGLSFNDVSESSGVEINGKWFSGVSVIDINSDGWQDIYLTATFWKDSIMRSNVLLINQGLNGSGEPLFKDQAKEYGLDDTGYSTHAAFFDYDLDGDLDVYILTNVLFNNRATAFRDKITDGSAENTDRLYRNNGNGKFSNVSNEAGITIEGFGLGLAISDINQDGWPDIYVSNDYLTNDILYINNKDGTFTNKISDLIGHQSLFSMGNDIADINNDGWQDIITVDMLPEFNERIKSTVGGNSYVTYIHNKRFGYEHQQVRNMLHLNNGTLNNNLVPFSEIGFYANMYQTEWSWSPLAADFDNDGYKDLLITNGFPKDVTDKDFGIYRGRLGVRANIRQLLDSIPEVKVSNYAFKNQGDLTFVDVTERWGLKVPTYSNGAAFSDLDNDGDLDYVVSNINDQAFIYENTLYYKPAVDSTNVNYLKVKLIDNKQNPTAIGAKVFVTTGEEVQMFEQNLSRGYLSSVDGVVHVGLGHHKYVDTLKVIWPDNSLSIHSRVPANQVIVIEKDKSEKQVVAPGTPQTQLFDDISSVLDYVHDEEDFIDFNIQRTIPHKYSQAGPAIAVGDINGDNQDDIVIGGSNGRPTMSFIQASDGHFKAGYTISKPYSTSEDQGLILFDCDKNGTLDLYVVSGGNESPPGSPEYQDRLYLNIGSSFKYVKEALPDEVMSGTCVRAGDFDNDDDYDLFVGGGVTPSQYPLSEQSLIYINENGSFKEHSKDWLPEKKDLGIIKDAIVTDFNNDNLKDLIVVGEFTEVMFLQNTGSHFTLIRNTGLDSVTGWWNSVVGSDIDYDGDTDYIVGNVGRNNIYQIDKKFPMTLVAKDFDSNGSIDPILGCYLKSEKGRELFPLNFWEELGAQIPKFRNKFNRFNQYGCTPLYSLLSAELSNAVILSSNNTNSCIIKNLGQGKFDLNPLPRQAQFSPVLGIVVDEFNNDFNKDILLVGNDYGNEVFAGRMDASIGSILLGQGPYTFRSSPVSSSGFVVRGDSKAAARILIGGNWCYAVSQNQGPIKFFRNGSKQSGQAKFNLGETYAIVRYSNGKSEKVESYIGSGYYSQSSNSFRIPANGKDITYFDSKGHTRKTKI